MVGVGCGTPRQTYSLHAAIWQESGESFALRD
jgi:hypothetical protein